ncbi:uncharacterized protein DNG_08728 [Cephalotrichum gorgonifer]|uniref:Uncharacterized protein n=1 Tax=Cephalotrichum gorgonifer TaxID=2041049 RepID=A0AAE8N5K7_9PEZI|nr:uncharacterized protein DNG_08728 [Cephalotrichum gorgonifer]
MAANPEHDSDIIIDMEPAQNPASDPTSPEGKGVVVAVGEKSVEAYHEIAYVPEPEDLPEPPCTTNVLQNFGVVNERNRLRRVSKYLDPWAEEDDEQAQTLQKLRRWRDVRNTGIWGRVKAAVGMGKATGETGSSRPGDEELEKLVLHHFPAPGEFPVRIVDFGPDGSKKYEVSLKTCLDEFIHEKPADVHVRWIYAPVGPGLISSCFDDLFLNAGKRQTKVLGAGKKAWPYLAIESLSFRQRESYMQMRDVFSILGTDTPTNASLRARLDKRKSEGMGEALATDLAWRCEHLGMESGFWDLVYDLVPYHLTQISTQETTAGPKDIVDPNGAGHIYQTLWSHPSFQNGQLVRTMVWNYHREDGMLLTMGAPCGVEYLDKDFDKWLGQSKRRREDNEEASVFAFLCKRFEKSGTRDWPQKTVEYFLIYLLTEVAASPHNIRQGRALTRLTVAYKQIVEKLKLRRYDRFRRHESIALVRDFLTCQDELTCICNVMRGRLTLLENLESFLSEIDPDREGKADNEDPVSPTQCESALGRVQWALPLVKEQLSICEALLVDLRLSTEALFQLKSIEQNELAIVAESQNKAILVFTAVTVIFLPLSFFTSYFGMNLADMEDPSKNESWFWRVCGVVGVLLVVLTSSWAFRQELRERFFGNGCMTAPSADVMIPDPGRDVDMNNPNAVAPLGSCGDSGGSYPGVSGDQEPPSQGSADQPASPGSSIEIPNVVGQLIAFFLVAAISVAILNGLD